MFAHSTPLAGLHWQSIQAVKICWLSLHCWVENMWHNFFLKTRHNSCQITHDFICFSQWHQCFRKKFPPHCQMYSLFKHTLRYHSCEDVIEANSNSCRIHRPPNTFKLSTAALMGKRRWSVWVVPEMRRRVSEGASGFRRAVFSWSSLGLKIPFSLFRNRWLRWDHRRRGHIHHALQWVSQVYNDLRPVLWCSGLKIHFKTQSIS